MKRPTPRDTGDDALASYFRELSQHDLLTSQQERKLSRDIQRMEISIWEQAFAHPSLVIAVLAVAMPHLDRETSFPKLLAAVASGHEFPTAAKEAAKRLRELDLDRRAADALIAALIEINATAGLLEHAFITPVRAAYRESARLRERFVSANLRLVITMAKRYDQGQMPLADLIQEGNLGLMHAVARFDHKRGLRFSTYACWWIRHAIGRAVADKARTVRVPVHMAEVHQQIERARTRLAVELQRAPTTDEVSAACKIPREKIEQLDICITGAPVSLDQTPHVNVDYTMIDMLVDPDTEEHTAEDDVEQRSVLAQMHRLMGELNPLEHAILVHRFGLAGADGRTLRDIGEEYGLSRERIRQIQNGALDRLKALMQREYGKDLGLELEPDIDEDAPERADSSECDV